MPPSATQLIVNADDFGLTAGVNRAIAELSDAGVLTSATLMAHGSAFPDAIRLAKAHPGLAVGCHIVLTDGVPVSPPSSVPSLLGPDRRSLRPSLNRFLAAALLGQVDADEVRREAVAQIRHLQDAGLRVTHLDTHKHTHILPAIARPLLEAAEATGVPAIRNPFEGAWSLRLGYTRLFRLVSVAGTRLLRRRFLALPALRFGRIVTTDGTVGISATGHLSADLLRKIVSAMPPGTWELVCHPGYNDADLDQVTTRLRGTREVERDALLSVLAPATRASLHRPPLDLIHYGRLNHGGPN